MSTGDLNQKAHEHREYMRYVAARDPVLNRLAGVSTERRSGYASHDGMGIPLTPNEVVEIGHHLNVGFFAGIGLSLNTVLGVLIGLGLVKLLLAIAVRMWAIYQSFGFGPKMLAAVFSATTQLALFPLRLITQAVAEAVRPVDAVPLVERPDSEHSDDSRNHGDGWGPRPLSENRARPLFEARQQALVQAGREPVVPMPMAALGGVAAEQPRQQRGDERNELVVRFDEP